MLAASSVLALLVVGLAAAQETKSNGPPAKDNTAPAGFTALFNGNDMSGWTEKGKAPVHWTAKDGVLSFDGRGADLFSVGKFSNFVLFVDWKVEKNGNSGVYLRGGNPQAEINDADNPKSPLSNGTSGGLYPDKAPTKRAAKPTGEWNRFEITVEKGVISVILNGEKTIDSFKKEWSKNAGGSIGFQNHGTPVWYKNIYIKKLDD